MEDFQDIYLQNGWEIISSISKIWFSITSVIIVLFFNPDHPFYVRGVWILPMGVVMFFIMDKIYNWNKKHAEKLHLATVFMIGFIVVRGNLKFESYYFNEFWITFILYSEFIAFFMFLKWKRVIFSLYIISIVYLILLNWYYDVPFILYVALAVVWILLPITSFLVSQKVIEIFILTKQNSDLIYTIRNILQILSEAVIIRSFILSPKRLSLSLRTMLQVSFFHK